jgi:hypothetical protein
LLNYRNLRISKVRRPDWYNPATYMQAFIRRRANPKEREVSLTQGLACFA